MCSVNLGQESSHCPRDEMTKGDPPSPNMKDELARVRPNITHRTKYQEIPHFKAEPIGKFTELNAYIRNEDVANQSFKFLLWETRGKDPNKPKARRKTIKVNAEIHEVENRKMIKKINETKIWYFEKNQWSLQTSSKTGKNKMRETRFTNISN